MELELVEPYLALERGAGAVDRFCDALAAAFGDDGVSPGAGDGGDPVEP